MRGVLFSSAWLWAAIFVVVLAVTARLVYSWLRRRGGAPLSAAAAHSGAAELPLVCPACKRGFAAGTQYCPVDASRLQLHASAVSADPGRGGKCPRCRRAFEAGMRFCPMDAEELVPLQLWHASHAEGGVHVEANTGHLVGGQGKICPVCASKYDLEAGYCGRDASELVTVN
jgi:RNA polymerase subunit RPABC4/transcription elongation factor Spt4